MQTILNQSGSYSFELNVETKSQLHICCHQINLQCLFVCQRESIDATKQQKVLLILLIALHKLMVNVNWCRLHLYNPLKVGAFSWNLPQQSSSYWKVLCILPKEKHKQQAITDPSVYNGDLPMRYTEKLWKLQTII